MSMARAIKAGEAFVEATVRDKTDAGLRSATGKLKSFAKTTALIGVGIAGVGAAFDTIGAAILGPLALSVRQFESLGSELHDMSMRTGVATDTLSELKFAAEQSGASLADVGAAIRTMQKNGFSADQFDSVAASIAAIADPTEQTAQALKIFGKSGFKLLPMLKELSSLRANARGLGLSVSPKDAAAADALGDALGKVGSVLTDLKFEIGAALAAPLTRAAEAVAGMLATVADWVSKNHALVATIAAVGAAAAVIGGVLVGLGATMVAVAAAVAGLSALFAALITPVGAAVAIVSGVIIALLAGAAGWLIFSEAGRQAAADFGTFLGGIADAIAAGDILNAWGQLGLGMQHIWLQMVGVCKAAFYELRIFAIGMISEMLRDIAGALGEFESLTGVSLGGNSLTGAANALDMTAQIQAAKALADSQNSIAGTAAALAVLRGMVRSPQAEQASRAAAAGVAAMPAVAGGSSGTFNAAAAGLLGRSGGPIDRTAKSTELIARLMADVKAGIAGVKDAVEELPDELDTGFAFE